MRRRAIGLAIVFTLVACGGDAAVRSTPTETPTPTASSGPSVDTRTYEGDGYSFSYPASWIPSEPATGFVEVVISAPPAARQDGVLPNINVVVEPLRLELSTDEYYLASKQTVVARSPVSSSSTMGGRGSTGSPLGGWTIAGTAKGRRSVNVRRTRSGTTPGM